MKQQLIKILFIVSAITLMLGMFGLAEILSKIISMNMIITVAYIALGYSFIYLIRN